MSAASGYIARQMRIRLIQPPLVQPRWRQLTLPVVGAEFARFFEVEACDENVEPLDESPVELVGISAHVYNAPRAFAIARRFRERGSKVIIGGTFATIAPQLVEPHCDAVIVGELEEQTETIAADAMAGTLKPIYRAPEPPALKRTVLPDIKLLDARRYLRFNYPLETSRGCRFACRFCTNQLLFGRPRVRAIDDVARDLAQHDHGQVEIIDQNFFNDHRFAAQVIALLSKAPVPGWFAQTTVADLIDDPALVDRLAASRCRSLFVGLETVSEAGLRSLRKSWSRPDRFARLARRLQDSGVLLQVGLIVGLETDDAEIFEQTLAYLEQARIHAISISFLHAYPETIWHRDLEEQGRLRYTDLSELDGNTVTIASGDRAPTQMHDDVRRFLRKLYSSRSILKRALHRGMLDPAQLVNHLAVNIAMRSYYRDLERRWAPQNTRREDYRRGLAQKADFEHWLADAVSGVVERLWAR